jgi:hypothetical protein
MLGGTAERTGLGHGAEVTKLMQFHRGSQSIVGTPAPQLGNQFKTQAPEALLNQSGESSRRYKRWEPSHFSDRAIGCAYLSYPKYILEV